MHSLPVRETLTAHCVGIALDIVLSLYMTQTHVALILLHVSQTSWPGIFRHNTRTPLHSSRRVARSRSHCATDRHICKPSLLSDLQNLLD